MDDMCNSASRYYVVSPSDRAARGRGASDQAKGGIGLAVHDPAGEGRQEVAKPSPGVRVREAAAGVEFLRGPRHLDLGIDEHAHAVVKSDLAQVKLGANGSVP